MNRIAGLFCSLTEQQVSLLTMLAAWVAVIAAFLAVGIQTSATRKLTKQQFFLQLYAQWESADMQQRRADLATVLLGSPATVEIDDSVFVFLETLAHCTRRGLVDQQLVWTTFSIDVSGYWPAVQDYVNHIPLSGERPVALRGAGATVCQLHRDPEPL